MFYVYEWYNIDTNEIFYVGKGCKRRYKIVAGRNEDFLHYHATHNVDVRIVKEFEKEEDAFKYEEELLDLYWKQNQPLCNRKQGGNGGVAGIWTDEMRQKMSEENPMKAEEQRIRMSIYNPMKDPKVAQEISKQRSTPVIIDGTQYNSAREASVALNVHIETVRRWCKRGYNTDGNPCRYANQEQPDFQIKTTCSKSVIVDGQIFPSVRAAADFIGVKDSSPLVRALKANKTYKGHIVAYANQQPSKENS